MASYNRKLDQFISTIITDANAESTGLLKEVDQRRSEFLDIAESELLAEMYGYIRAKAAEARSEAGRRISKKTLENKKALFACRSEIAKKVLANVQQRIVNYVKTPEYLTQLENMAVHASKLLESRDIEILLRPDDMIHASALAAKVPAAYTAGEIELGGLIAISEEKSLRVDLTYDASFAEVSDKFGELSGFGV